jgi:cysteine synthase
VTAPASSVLKTIGGTPVVKLQRLVPAGSADVYMKLAYFNPTGSHRTGWRWR